MNSDSQPRNPIPPPSSDPLPLHPWTIGPQVVELQELLNAHGYALKIDGDFGYRTEAAVKDFQRQRHLRIDGVVNAATWAALRDTLQPGARILVQGHRGADVWELQGLLRVNGYLIDRTGLFDVATRKAVMQFQQRHKLRVTGEVDRVTWVLLRGVPSLPPPKKQTSWIWNFRRWW